MKFTGENLTHVGFYVKAKLSVNQCGTGGKRVNEGAVPDVEKPNYPADGFFFVLLLVFQWLLAKQTRALLSKENGI